MIVWGIAFIVYQQLQDRVIQPIFYRNAVRIHPVVAIAAVLAGAQLAGILGALLAIPTAAVLGVDLRRALAGRRGRARGRSGGSGRARLPAEAPASG